MIRFLCPSCERLADVSAVRVEDGRALLRCGRCGAEAEASLSPQGDSRLRPTPAYPLPAAGADAGRVFALRAVSDAGRLAAEALKGPDPFAPPEDRCPKCVAPRRPDALTCPACGLVYVNYVPAETAPSPELATAFREAMADWDDAALHDRVLAVGSRLGELPALGRLYRLRQAAAPMDPIARRGLDEVLRRATAVTEALRNSPAPERDLAIKWQTAAVAVLGVVVAVLLVVLVRALLSG